MIARILTTIIGIIFVVYGVIAAISPLPLGVPLIVLGLLMIAGANPAARPLIRRMRKKWRWFDTLVVTLAKRSPRQFHDVEKETKPGTEADEDDEAAPAKDDADEPENENRRAARVKSR